VDTETNEGILALDGGSTANESLLFVTSADLASLLVTTASAFQGSVTAGAVAVTTVTRMAGRVSTNNNNIAKLGTLGTADTSSTNPSAPTRITVGARGDSSLPSFGVIRRIAVFNSALTDAQLQTVTT
jgi:hypothetical protein